MPLWHFPTGRKFEREIDINIPSSGEIVPIPLASSSDFSREKPNTAVWPLPSAPTGRTNKAQANGLGLEMSLNPKRRAL